ncbi:hypothetical protein CDAR_462971 [Caerostris darwini]|uniref:Uncharacterized protein n=1 Tax=Caerostris darwini TaxID=1538125 RepID=A0AAV4Q9U7_9ARAC|nr:hypothetical protein CDAR_462971 [Caerostris darwini]
MNIRHASMWHKVCTSLRPLISHFLVSLSADHWSYLSVLSKRDPPRPTVLTMHPKNASAPVFPPHQLIRHPVLRSRDLLKWEGDQTLSISHPHSTAFKGRTFSS